MQHPQLPDNQTEEFKEMGREMGAIWLMHAIQSSPNAAQVAAQIALLQVASIHLLATCAMNAETNVGVNADVFLERVFTEIRAEYAHMKTELVEGRLEHVKTPTVDPNPNLH